MQLLVDEAERALGHAYYRATDHQASPDQRYYAWACALPAAARMPETSAFQQPPALLLWVANDAERRAFDVSPVRALPT